MSAQLETWSGRFGDEYTARQPDNTQARVAMWDEILAGVYPASILEVGAGSGENLRAIREMDASANLYGLEPNRSARSCWRGIGAVPGCSENIEGVDEDFEFVFTCGVLIHIAPDRLLQACSEIVRVSSRYVLAIEYFSDEPEEKPYRGHSGLLWKRDFGAFYMDNFKLHLAGYGFFWERATGLNNLNWWLFEK